MLLIMLGRNSLLFLLISNICIIVGKSIYVDRYIFNFAYISTIYVVIILICYIFTKYKEKVNLDFIKLKDK